jgi:hypothetical protein
LAKVRRHTGGRRLWSGGAAFMFSRIVYLFLKFRFHVNLGGLRPSWLLMIECVPNNLPAKKKIAPQRHAHVGGKLVSKFCRRPANAKVLTEYRAT